MKSQRLPFKPRARLLLLLGDQLIRDAGIAVFELVKNAYDADASEVKITMKNLHDESTAQIIVQDDGTGMDWDTVQGVWLEPGTDNRGKQREENRRSEKHNRLPLGEKGVGRFAGHKLGQRIRLVTRARNKSEIVVTINWLEFEEKKYLADVPIKLTEREPQVFKGKETGTRITISELRNTWTRGMVRDLHRSVTSISSPFNAPEDFKTSLALSPDPGEKGNPRNPGWLDDLLTTDEVLDQALYTATCSIKGSQLKYSYEFMPLRGMNRVDSRSEEKTMPISFEQLGGSSKDREEKKKYRLENYKIGEVFVELNIFDLDAQVMRFIDSDKKGLRQFLGQNGGVRVYRDGIRVYDYGEQGNDWLDFGAKRVNRPTTNLSNNQVIGAVSISLDESQDLIEKTNREGFIENDAFQSFKENISFAIRQIEAERNKDKFRIRNAYSSKKQKEPVVDEILQLRDKLDEKGLTSELSSYLDRIERQFIEVRDQLLTTASAGLSFSVVIHEVEKGVKELAHAIDNNRNIEIIRGIAKHLSELIEGLAHLFRQSGQKIEKASTIIKQSLFNVGFRLKAHNIQVINGVAANISPDLKVKCVRRLIISILMNLIDNSIFWLANKGHEDKKIYIGTTQSLKGGPAIVFSDNGSGFIDLPEYLVQPFFTRKPDGMGLGLHIASEIMKVHKGMLEFPEPSDVELPKGIESAVVALIFEEL